MCFSLVHVVFSNELHNFVYSEFEAIHLQVRNFLFIWSSLFSQKQYSASAVDTEIYRLRQNCQWMVEKVSLLRSLRARVPSHQYKHAVFLVGSQSHQREPSLALSLVEKENTWSEGIWLSCCRSSPSLVRSCVLDCGESNICALWDKDEFLRNYTIGSINYAHWDLIGLIFLYICYSDS